MDEPVDHKICSTDMELALAMSGLGRFEMWVRYLALGGQASPLELDAFFNDSMEFPDLEHDILSQALNERLVEVGLSPLLTMREPDPKSKAPRRRPPGATSQPAGEGASGSNP